MSSSFIKRIRKRLGSNTAVPENVVVEEVPSSNQQEIPISNQEEETIDQAIPISNQEEETIDQAIPISNQQEEPVDEEVASTIPDEPKPSRWRDDLYIQTRKSFQRTTKEAFALDQIMSEMPPLVSMEMHYYRSVSTAIFIQNIFHNVALILQGFLSGFSLFHTIMAFGFVDIVLLVKDYQYLSAPIHATFYFCFVISAIDAMDRFETGESWRQTLGRLIGLQRGGLGLLIAVSGTAVTVIMTRFEQYLSMNLNNDIVPQKGKINLWHWLSAIRSVCAISAWLLIALQPSANYTRDQLIAMAPEIRSNIDPTNISIESNQLANAQIISSLANSAGNLELSQEFLTSIKVLAAHQQNQRV